MKSEVEYTVLAQRFAYTLFHFRELEGADAVFRGVGAGHHRFEVSPHPHPPCDDLFPVVPVINSLSNSVIF